MADENTHEENPLQGYFDWQVTTLMLAYDLHDPIARDDHEAAEDRRRQIVHEVSRISLEVLPQKYRDNPNLDWPPSVMMLLTRTTLAYAAGIAGFEVREREDDLDVDSVS